MNLKINLSFDGSEIDSIVNIIKFVNLLNIYSGRTDFKNITIHEINNLEIKFNGKNRNNKNREYEFSYNSIPKVREKEYKRSFIIYDIDSFGISIGGNNAIMEDIALEWCKINFEINIEIDSNLLSNIKTLNPDSIEQYIVEIIDEYPWDTYELENSIGDLLGIMVFLLSDDLTSIQIEKLFDSYITKLFGVMNEKHQKYLKIIIEFAFLKLNRTQRASYAKNIIGKLTGINANLSSMIYTKFLKYFCAQFVEVSNNLEKVLDSMFEEEGAIKGSYDEKERWLLCEAFGFVTKPADTAIYHLIKICNYNLDDLGNYEDVIIASLYSATTLISSSTNPEKYKHKYESLLLRLIDIKNKTNLLTITLLYCLAKYLRVYMNNNQHVKDIIKYITLNLNNSDDIVEASIKSIAEVINHARVNNSTEKELFLKLKDIWINTKEFSIRRQAAISLIDIILQHNKYDINYNLEPIACSRKISSIKDLIVYSKHEIGNINLLAETEFKIDISSILLASLSEQFRLLIFMRPFLHPTYKKDNFYNSLSNLLFMHAEAEDMIYPGIDSKIIIEKNEAILHQLHELIMKKYFIDNSIELRKLMLLELFQVGVKENPEKILNLISKIKETFNNSDHSHAGEISILNVLNNLLKPNLTAKEIFDTIREIDNSYSNNLKMKYSKYFNKIPKPEKIKHEDAPDHSQVVSQADQLVQLGYVIVGLFGTYWISKRRQKLAYRIKSDFNISTVQLRMIGVLNIARDYAL